MIDLMPHEYGWGPDLDAKITRADIVKTMSTLTGIFGYAFSSQFGDATSMEIWYRVLQSCTNA